MSIFSPKKSTVTQTEMMPDWQLQTGKDLSQWVQQYLKQYTPGEAYGGRMSADKTPFEEQGLGLLSKFLAQPESSDVLDAGNQQIMDTLGGKYMDPNTSPYIKAMLNLGNQNLADQIKSERATRGARGTYFTKAGIDAEGTLRERTMNNLNAVIGQFINNERQNILNTVPMAQQMDQYKTMTKPGAKIDAAMSVGSLDRVLEQADLERQYQDFVRQRNEQSNLTNTAQSLYSTSVPYGVKSVTTKAPNTFMKMLGEFSPIAGSYNTATTGYDKNQASIKEAFGSGGGGGDIMGMLMKLLGGGV